MVNTNVNISKVCSFYVSDWHFVTMLLPHVSKTMDEGERITTILENSAQEQVEILLKKLNLQNYQKIIDINWNKKNLENLQIENLIRDVGGDKEFELIISGSLEYINKANKMIIDYITENKINSKIKIIDCYLVTDNLNIKEILDNHSTVLNTAGEKPMKDFKKSISMMI